MPEQNESNIDAVVKIHEEVVEGGFRKLGQREEYGMEEFWNQSLGIAHLGKKIVNGPS